MYKIVRSSIIESVNILQPKSHEDIIEDLFKLSQKEKDQSLLNVSEKGHIKLVKLLLDAGANVHAGDDYALRWASQNGHTEVVKLLLGKGANVHVGDDYALRWASQNGRTEVVKLLLDAGANVHAEDDCALRWASANGRIEVIKLLLDKGANVHAGDDYALRWASSRGHTELVKLLLNRGADVHAKDDYAFRWACKGGHIDAVKLLLDAGANVHAEDDIALRWAREKGHTEVVKLLKSRMNESFYPVLEATSDILKPKSLSQMDLQNLSQYKKNKMLSVASRNGYVELVKLLLDNGAKVSANNYEAFRQTCQFNKLFLAKILYDKFVDVHAIDDEALRFSAQNGHVNIVRFLLDVGADVHADNDYALRWASENGHTEVVKLLIDAGANVHAGDDYALRRASSRGHAEVVKILLNAGANVHAGDDFALKWASANGHTEVVKLLKSRMEVVEGVGDKLAASHFGIYDKVDKFDDEYAVSKLNKDQVIQVNEKAYVVKNPSNINELGENVRGFIDKDGNLYLSLKANCIHQTILDALVIKGVLPNRPNWWKTLPLSFISVQRVKSTNTIAMGESNLLLDDPYPYTEDQVNTAFKQIIDRARRLHPRINIEFKHIKYYNRMYLKEEQSQHGLPSFEELVSRAPLEIKELVENCATTLQSPTWHPEGDCRRHIKIVYNRALKTGDLNMVLAALFHDLGKVSTTHPSEKTPGSWSAYGHENESTKILERHRAWVESLGADFTKVHEVVKNHMRIKLIDEMTTPKKNTLLSNPYIEFIKKFSEFDTMSTLTPEELSGE